MFRSVLVAIGSLIALGAVAQMPPRATTKVGDVHVYVAQQKADKASFEETVTVTAVSANGFKTRHTRTGRPQDIDGDYDSDWNPRVSGSNGGRFDPPSKALVFPLDAGRQWPNNYRLTFPTGGSAQVEGEAKVAGPQKLQTPAGEFDVVRIDFKGYSRLGSGGFHFTQSLWYAPAIDRLVRLEYKEIRTMGADNVTELKSFKPGP